jgi:DNA (cytosine-5)-methyltransferase 1
MIHGAYYNEIDSFKAEVIRQAIKAGAVALGDVDGRSIADVRPDDLRGYAQCHFFAGGGFWSLALRSAGWSDDRPVWTGSCPCSSFSAAGKGEGFADSRHLWPEWIRLIRECRPSTIFGEQVAAAIGHGWLDLVSTDLETESYAFAASVLGAHSVGAPHIRQRLYFVAVDNSAGTRCEGPLERPEGNSRDETWMRMFDDGRSTMRMGEPIRSRLEGHIGNGGYGDEPGRVGTVETGSATKTGEFVELDNTRRSPLNGFWRNADWIGCRDGRFRPVKPGTFPLATGYPGRMGLLRIAGDAICVPTAQAFIESYMNL